MIPKYRAKRLDRNKWVYGVPVETEKRCWLVSSPGTSFADGDLMLYYVEVDPETVGQWTGLQDKKGKEIYSDDLVVAHKYPFYSDGQLNYIAKVQWIFSSWQYVYILVNKELHGASHGINIGIDEIASDCVEIVGNSYDNPELVK